MSPDTVIVFAKNGQGRDYLPLWTALAGGAIGLLGASVAAWNARKTALEQIAAQREIAKSQIHSTVLSGNRIRWIEQVRSEVAGFMGSCIALATDAASGVTESRVQRVDVINSHLAMVKLLLNHNETASTDLVAAMDRAVEMFNEHATEAFTPVQASEMEKRVDYVGEKARHLLKTEWTRVKQIE